MHAFFDSIVQIHRVFGVFLNELLPGLHLFAHQHRKRGVGGHGVVQGDAAQGALPRVHGGLPQLMGIHLAQSLEAADVDLHVGIPRPHFGGNGVPLLVGIGNPLLLALYGLLPHRLIAIILWAALVIFAIDAVGTLLAMLGLRYRWAAGAEIENRLANFTVNTGMALLGWVEQRMNKAHPALTFRRQRRAKSTTFAEGCSPYKIILLFFIGAFLGDITETIFCRITAGYWMSRSSVVWGPFSIVWGLAIAAVTQLLYRYKDRPASWLFVAGTLLGGAYEYLCSVFTEVVFGTVFWDYSAIPFNLGGRINLLYCFFWGFAAIAWFKVLYPPISHMIESLPKRFGTVLTWGLCVFMAANIAVSSAALVRYNERVRGEAAATSLAACLDEHFDDARMAKVYPKAVHVEK